MVMPRAVNKSQGLLLVIYHLIMVMGLGYLSSPTFPQQFVNVSTL